MEPKSSNHTKEANTESTENRQQASPEETKKQLTEYLQNNPKALTEVEFKINRSIGGLGNSNWKKTEDLFAIKLPLLFSELGFQFDKYAEKVRFTDDKQVLLTMTDLFLEGNEYTMPVEIVNDITVDDIIDHIEQIELVRKSMATHNDNRKLIGTIAGRFVPADALIYAYREGVFIAIQSGNTVTIADTPQNFKARQW